MKPNQEGMECWVDEHMHLNRTTKQHHQIQAQQDQGWDTLLLMQDVPCTGHQKKKLG
jgi:hypothetical protein